MECYKNEEMKRLRTGFLLMAAAVFIGGSLLILAERGACQASFERAANALYGESRAVELLALAGQRSYGRVWLFAGLTAALFAAGFFFMTRGLTRICRELGHFSLCLEQMTAGRAVSLAEWKEGILASLGRTSLPAEPAYG